MSTRTWVLASTVVALSACAPDVENGGLSVSELRSVNGRLWVTDRDKNLAVALDARTGAHLGSVGVGVKPIGIVAPRGSGRGKVYTCNEGANTVTVIDKATMMVTATIGVQSMPHHAHASVDGRYVYCAEFGQNTIVAIDTRTDAFADRFIMGPSTARTHAPWASQDGKSVWGTNRFANTITEVDFGTKGITRTRNTATNPSEVVVTPNGSIAYVTARDANKLQAFDLNSNAPPAEATLANQPDTISLTADQKTLFIGLRGKPAGAVPRAAIVDARTLTVVYVNLPGSQTGHNAVSPNGSYAFIAYEFVAATATAAEVPGGIAVVDLEAGTVVAQYSYPGAKLPHGLVYDPADGE